MVEEDCRDCSLYGRCDYVNTSRRRDCRTNRNKVRGRYNEFNKLERKINVVADFFIEAASRLFCGG